MDRRSFLKKAGLSAGLATGIPYILPAGTLFAPTGKRLVNHVILYLFAGGVRNIEALQKSEGNLMPYTLRGSESITSDIRDGMTPLPTPPNRRLQSFGTLFKEFRFTDGPTAHISAHLTAVTGRYFINGHDPKKRPPCPTVFELYRKHTSPSSSPLNAWWIADRSDPFFNFSYSSFPGYGPEYGANYLQPRILLGNSGYNNFAQPAFFEPNQMDSIEKVRAFVNNNFSRHFNPGDAGVVSTEDDAEKFKDFIFKCTNEAREGLHLDPWKLGQQHMNEDMYNVFYTEKIIQHFQPELSVVNMLEIDKGHVDFTLYCNNIRRADYALMHLWNTVQSTPGLANDTIIIAVPEHGRNLEHNTVRDQYGRFAIDHTSTPTSREIFCLVLGPEGIVKQNQVVQKIHGESIDVVPTVAKILGFYDQVAALLPGKPLDIAFN